MRIYQRSCVISQCFMEYYTQYSLSAAGKQPVTEGPTQWCHCVVELWTKTQRNLWTISDVIKSSVSYKAPVTLQNRSKPEVKNTLPSFDWPVSLFIYFLQGKLIGSEWECSTVVHYIKRALFHSVIWALVFFHPTQTFLTLRANLSSYERWERCLKREYRYSNNTNNILKCSCGEWSWFQVFEQEDLGQPSAYCREDVSQLGEV